MEKYPAPKLDNEIIKVSLRVTIVICVPNSESSVSLSLEKDSPQRPQTS
jgi:hypothetical protein